MKTSNVIGAATIGRTLVIVTTAGRARHYENRVKSEARERIKEKAGAQYGLFIIITQGNMRV